MLTRALRGAPVGRSRRRPRRREARAPGGQACRSCSTTSTTTMRDPDAVRAPPGRSARVLAAGGGDGHRAEHRDPAAPASPAATATSTASSRSGRPTSRATPCALERLLVDARHRAVPAAGGRARARSTTGSPGCSAARPRGCTRRSSSCTTSIGAMNERLAFSAYERMSEILTELGEHGAGRDAHEAAPPRRVRPPRLLPHRGP